MQEPVLINKATIKREHAIEFLSRMHLIRRFEEKSAEMYSKQKIRGFLHLYIGEEAVAVGLMHNLRKEDKILSTYREHGHALARGLDPRSIMAEMFGKQEGCSRGRGGSMHLFDITKNFYGGNAIVAGHLPMAVGLALAIKKQKEDAISCCIFGDGAIAEGEFHESMNLAALWQVPLLLVCENNLYAMGTALRYSHSMIDLEKKAAAYNITSALVDGMDVLAVEDAVKKALDYIKQTGRPFFLVCNTYRFRAHSMFDAELYRDKSEVEEWKKKDPINIFKTLMLSTNILSNEDIDKIELQTEQEVQRAVDFAEKGSWESVEQLQNNVY